MTKEADLPALRQLGRTSVRLRTLLADHDHTKLPADLVQGLLEEVQAIDRVLEAAGRGVERNPKTQ